MKILKKIEQSIENNAAFELNENEIVEMRGLRLSETSSHIRDYLEYSGIIDDSNLYNDEEEFIGDTEEFILIEGGSRAPLMWISENEYMYSEKVEEFLAEITAKTKNKNVLKWVNTKLREYLIKGGIVYTSLTEAKCCVYFLQTDKAPDNFNNLEYEDIVTDANIWAEELLARANSKEEMVVMDATAFIKILTDPEVVMPDNVEISGDLNLEGHSVRDMLPKGVLIVGGILNLSLTDVTSLPSSLSVGKGLLLRGTRITKWPKGALSVVPTFDIRDTEIAELPEGLRVKGDLLIKGSLISELPKGLVVDGNLDLAGTSIKSIPSDLVIGKNLNLENSPVKDIPKTIEVKGEITKDDTSSKSQRIKDLEDKEVWEISAEQFRKLILGKNKVEWPNRIVVEGDLDLKETSLIELPAGLKIEGNLELDNSSITTLPAGLSVEGDLDLRDTQITILPAGLSVKWGLDLRDTQITELPAGLSVGGYLFLEGTQISSLPAGLHVGESLYLEGTQITELPADLSVGGYLNLEGTQITELPAGLSVEGDLDLRDTQITILPAGLSVGGTLWLDGSQITTLPEDLKVGGGIIGLEWIKDLEDKEIWELSAEQFRKLILGKNKVEWPNKIVVEGDLELKETRLIELPAGLNIEGDLDLHSTQITKLPVGLKVGGGLYLEHSYVHTISNGLSVGHNLVLRHSDVSILPNGLKVGGNLYLDNTQITGLPSDLSVGGEIIGFNPEVSLSNKEELSDIVGLNNFSVSFVKTNGDTVSRLYSLDLPAEKLKGTGGNKKTNSGNVVVWDCESEGFKTLKLSSIISISVNGSEVYKKRKS